MKRIEPVPMPGIGIMGQPPLSVAAGLRHTCVMSLRHTCVMNERDRPPRATRLRGERRPPIPPDIQHE